MDTSDGHQIEISTCDPVWSLTPYRSIHLMAKIVHRSNLSNVPRQVESENGHYGQSVSPLYPSIFHRSKIAVFFNLFTH